jgi:hypothetical protein
MSLTVRPVAWYDQSNGVVSTDKDDPRFTPLGQLLPLYPAPGAPVAYISGYHKGRCIIEAVDSSVLLPVGMALYRSPPLAD